MMAVFTGRPPIYGFFLQFRQMKSSTSPTVLKNGEKQTDDK